MDLDELLGIDLTDAVSRRARRLREADRQLLAELIKRRHELGLRQDEVARRMDTSQSTVARIESGTRDLHQSTLRRYAMAVEAVIEHRLIPDDRDRARSAEILRDLQSQMVHEPVPFDVSDSGSAAVRWTRAGRKVSSVNR